MMEICNKELVDIQTSLVKEYEQYQRELRYTVAREVAEFKKFKCGKN